MRQIRHRWEKGESPWPWVWAWRNKNGPLYLIIAAPHSGQVVAERVSSSRSAHALGTPDPPLTPCTLQVKKIATASPYNNIIVVSEDLAQ